MLFNFWCLREAQWADSALSIKGGKSSFLFKMVKCGELSENERVHIKALPDAGWSLRNERDLKQMADTFRLKYQTEGRLLLIFRQRQRLLDQREGQWEGLQNDHQQTKNKVVSKEENMTLFRVEPPVFYQLTPQTCWVATLLLLVCCSLSVNTVDVSDSI